MPSIDQAIIDKVDEIYADGKNEALLEIGQTLRPHFQPIVDTFYSTLLKYPETSGTLENKIVEKQLPLAIIEWLNLIFPKQSSDITVQEITDRHRELGALHAKINVNLNYLLYGLSIIKEEIYSRLKEHARAEDFMPQISTIFDFVTSTLVESYIANEMVHESNELSMRIKGLTQNMAIECERMRSMLLDWLSNTLNWIYQTDRPDLDVLPKLQLSNFGLWVVYKLDFITSDAKIKRELNRKIAYIDHLLFLSAKSKCDDDHHHFLTYINELNESVTSASWYISSIVDQVIEVDTGMDPLTRLFNRRYLETVLRRQTSISMQKGIVYSVLLIDIDHFKKINDQYGHISGDLVLKHFAEILLSSVRASDFIFRYGGEEFLVLGGNLDIKAAHNLAEKLRTKVARSKFMLQDDISISVTCSIGAAQHGGHPNYNLLLEAADKALYKAKQQGRDQTVAA